MPINPSNMRVVDVARLLNSTSFGFVLAQARLYREFNRVGFRIGSSENPRNINLLKYIAWMFDRKHTPEETSGARSYEDRRNAERDRQAEQSLAGRDIGQLPEVVNPNRKAACERNFQLFCESYFPETYALAWSPDHLKVIEKIETAVLRGGLFALAMPRGSGKALALDTPLPTQTGWTTMGNVQVGDWLFDEQGHQCRVIRKSEVFTDHDCYRVSFSDGETIVCDAGHLWQVEDIYGCRNPYVRDTEWLASRYKIGKRGHHESRFRIPMQKPLQIQSSGELPIAPYALGVWLGDGTCSGSEITLFDQDAAEIAQNIRKELGNENLTVCDYGQEDHAVLTVLSKSVHRNREKEKTGQARLRQLGLLNNKHIPKEYLRADCSDRLALLQGMLDTDGYADRKGHVEIIIKYSRLAEDFAELLSSLGIKFGMGLKTVMFDGKEHGPYHRFHFNGYRDQDFFQLKRKRERMRERPVRRKTEKGCLSHTPCDVRMIVNIEKVPTVPTQCVMVDSPSHLYLAGRKMVPTHNSTLAETAAVWAMLYGHREFITLIGATESAALELLDSLKTELEVNERLAEDFPEVCYPVAQLEGIANRCAGQLYKGERTRITWTSNEIVLPTVEGSRASGIIVRVAGITGRIRGMKFKRSDGRNVRPSLVVIDDPQTSESAGSLEQTRKRVRVLAGDILGLAGPGQKISGIMPCTIIRPGDMADIILNRNTHPDWNGEKTRMVYRFPTNMKLWEEYAEIRAEALRTEGNFQKATEFYLANREAMDAGAEVSWEARFNHDEVSALQHAMNLKFQDEAAFMSEYQNDPLPDDTADDSLLSVDEICAKINGLTRRRVPLKCDRLTMFVDVQKALLFYVVIAWAEDFTGAVVDYGAWPDQHRRQFSLADANPTIQSKFPKAGFEGGLYSALTALTDECLGREWEREDGAVLKIERALVDANWGQSTDVVYQFCRQSSHAGVILPSHGRYVGASSKPMTEYRKQQGDRLGFNWMIPNVAGKRAIRHVIYDTNYWKSFIHARLAVPVGDKGSLTLYGRIPGAHQLFAEHLTAEYRVKTQGRGRTVDEWKLKPQSHDNHFLDCVAGCAVCGSMLGASLPETLPAKLDRKPMIRLSDKRLGGIPPNGRLKLSELRRQKNG